MRFTPITFVLTLLFSIGTACAQNVTADEARERANAFFASHQLTGAHHAPGRIDPVLAYTAETNGTPDFYVFNRAADVPGYVIINADDASEVPVLGYAEATVFDYDSIPDNLRWWLKQYQVNGVAKAPAQAPGSRIDVPTMIKTKWDQHAPYNNKVPRHPEYGEFATGCIATAMAQVMKFYEHPKKGVGQNSYTIDFYPNGVPVTYSANFGSTTYDYANMLNTYKGTETPTPAQNNAVATLMYHAGVAANMSYWYSSGSDDISAGKAFMEHFDYDKGLSRHLRDHYTDDEWDEMVYNELAAGRPVFYCGDDTEQGGHAFICDGYRKSDGFFSFNWGWSGAGNGYYALAGSSPMKINAPYNSVDGSQFVNDQSILAGLRPNTGSSTSAPPSINYFYKEWMSNPQELGKMKILGNLRTSYTLNRASSSDCEVTFNYCCINGGFFPVSFSYGLLIRNRTTGDEYPVLVSATSNLDNNSYIESNKYGKSHFNTSILTYNGIYEVLPAYKLDGSDTWLPINLPKSYNICTITITGGIDKVLPAVDLTINKTTLNVGETATISHTNAYTGSITYTSSNTSVATVSNTGVVTAKAAGTVTITAKAAGNSSYKATSKNFSITVKALPSVDLTINKTTLNVGETATISHASAYTGSITYTSSNTSVATVSNTGVVTAKAAGTVTITAKAAGNSSYKATSKDFSITVKALPNVELTINKTTLYVGETATISHTNAYTGSIDYTSSNTSVATVSNTGVVSAKSAGTATITVNAAGNSAYQATNKNFTITVKELSPVEFDIDYEYLAVGETAHIIYTPQYTGSISFSSSNTSVASVNNAGLITALSPGTAIVTVTAAGNSQFTAASKSFTITVQGVGEEVIFTVDEQTVYVGECITVTVPDDYHGAVTATVDDVNVLQGEYPVFHAVGEGYATIILHAAADGDYAETHTEIDIYVEALMNADLEIENPNLTEGEFTYIYSMSGLFPSDVIYTVDCDGVVSIDDEGVIEAIGPGTATITATVNSRGFVCEDFTFHITVEAAKRAAQFSIDKTSIGVGEYARITTDFDGLVYYVIEPEDAISIDEDGLVCPTGSYTGGVMISCIPIVDIDDPRFNFDSTWLDLFINAPEPNEPIYAITNDRLLPGETAQINLTDGYASSTSYSSSDPAVVSVDAGGRVTALSNGTAFITITAYGDMMFSSITRQIKVVVSPQPGLSHEFCFCDYPVFGTSNIITSSSTQLQLHAVNRGFDNTSCTIYAVPHLDNGYAESLSIDYGVCASGSEFTSSEDVSLWLPHLTNGKVYRVDFYADGDCTRPMNVPSAYFIYCPGEPTATHIAKAIRQAKIGECPLRLINAIKEKVLHGLH